MSLVITSPVFVHNGPIPKIYTSDGKNISPPLNWNGIPDGTETLVLIVDDPDAPDPAAPTETWVHWLLYDLPNDATALPEGVKPQYLPHGSRMGRNHWDNNHYKGPCPPVGRHRYFFRLYALDSRLPDMGNPTKAELEQSMSGHILAQAELVGTYQHGK